MLNAEIKDVRFGTKRDLALRKQQRNFSTQIDAVGNPEFTFEIIPTNSSQDSICTSTHGTPSRKKEKAKY